MAVIVFWPLIAAFIATTQRSATPSMRIDFYDQTCPNAEKIIFAEVQKILRRPEFKNKATFEIPRPTDHIDKILRLFAQRGFTARETVALLGGHSIGFISCAFIRDRIDKVDNATDPYIPQDFHDELSRRCQNRNNNVSMMDPEQLSSSSSPLRSRFGTHYYESLTRRRGLLFSDMELMAHEQTAAVVEEYASDDDGSTFRRDFITALVKMSNLVTLTGSQGEVRLNCSVPLNS
ncbi:OLC1v1037804C1 [Oldenlandia corymbosa var. corymbosa]|uniref:peroxidase n=1 Tax=Oldenlandia corymbosa var. corymbosa TaxID=529605 RepID=A0AAV1D0W4_OLDCO|nr:OLC1v1037804C1 [Oldenlandia corymbosa var. corymbosa]